MLGEMAVNPMLDVFLELLPPSGGTDFGIFQVATSVLMKFDSGPQIAAIKKELTGMSVEKWAAYDKRIQCANNYTSDNEALEMVKKAIETEA